MPPHCSQPIEGSSSQKKNEGSSGRSAMLCPPDSSSFFSSPKISIREIIFMYNKNDLNSFIYNKKGSITSAGLFGRCQ
jgi:hypothetical protein